MKRVVIIDDEKISRDFVKSILQHNFPELQVVGEGDNVQTGLEQIRKHNPDIVFLDVDMPDGTGFDLLQKLDKPDFKLIFITAHSEYAIKAIKFSALDYILKPFDLDELLTAIRKAINELNSENDKLKILSFISNLQNLTASKKIVLNTADNIYVVNVKDIIRCVSEGNYTIFHIQANRRIIMSKTLKEYETLLSDFGFIRIHRSHLVNINFIERFVKEDSMLIMSDGSEVPVSSRKKDLLIEYLSKF